MSNADVKWEVQRLDGLKYLLRNMGTEVAHGVEITSDQDNVSRVNGSDSVFPGGALIFDVNHDPNEDVKLTVSWDSNDNGKLTERFHVG